MDRRKGFEVSLSSVAVDENKQKFPCHYTQPLAWPSGAPAVHKEAKYFCEFSCHLI